MWNGKILIDDYPNKYDISFTSIKFCNSYKSLLKLIYNNIY